MLTAPIKAPALYPKILACLGLVLLADILFFNHPWGGTLGAFAVLLLGAFSLFNPQACKSTPGKIIFWMTIIEALLLVDHPTTLRLILYILGLAALAILGRGSPMQNGLTFGDDMIGFLARMLVRLPADIHKYNKAKQHRKTVITFATRIGGWILPISLAVIFIILFGNANPIFTRWFDKMNWNFISDYITFGRIFFWSLCMVLFWAVLRPRIKLSNADDKKAPEGKTVLDGLFTRQSILRSLILFNIIFAIQTAMDVTYLWAGASLPEGLSYAEYAQRGAYTLVATALLAAAFVLIVLREGKESDVGQLARNFIYFWIAQNIFLMVSSIWRLNLYIEEYSLTYLRFSALVWMGLVAIGLVLIVIRMVKRKSNLWLINANSLTLAFVLMSCSTLNMGGIIAHYNVRHNQEVSGVGRVLDISYLAELGPSSIPAITWLEEQKPAYRDNEYLQTIKRRLHNKLAFSQENWREWTFQNHRTLRQMGSPAPL